MFSLPVRDSPPADNSSHGPSILLESQCLYSYSPLGRNGRRCGNTVPSPPASGGRGKGGGAGVPREPSNVLSATLPPHPRPSPPFRGRGEARRHESGERELYRIVLDFSVPV